MKNKKHTYTSCPRAPPVEGVSQLLTPVSGHLSGRAADACNQTESTDSLSTRVYTVEHGILTNGNGCEATDRLTILICQYIMELSNTAHIESPNGTESAPTMAGDAAGGSGGRPAAVYLEFVAAARTEGRNTRSIQVRALHT